MSIEVYIINTVLAIPVFFFLRWLFRCLVKDDRKRRVTTWAATILLTPILYALIILTIIFSASYYPSKEFDKQQWLTDKEKRFEFSEDIIERKILVGQTKPEVRLLLGDEGNSNESDHWSYYLGIRPQLFKIDPDILIIEFKDGVAVRVEQHGT